MLKQVKVGDKVQFEAEGADGGFTVTKIQKSARCRRTSDL